MAPKSDSKIVALEKENQQLKKQDLDILESIKAIIQGKTIVFLEKLRPR